MRRRSGLNRAAAVSVEAATPTEEVIGRTSLASSTRPCGSSHSMSPTVIAPMIRRVTRWEPDARGRLEQAAMELFKQRGFEQTTVAEIAAHAGLTERTFFRHYADKREVLFGGSDQLRDVLVGAVAGAPVSAKPIEAVAAGLEA